MTVLVGLMCKDGLVVASDSQESDEDYTKRLGVRKIYDTGSFGFVDAELLLGGSGSNGYIKKAVELITDAGYAPFFTRPREVANIVEQILGKMARRHGYGPEGKGLDVGFLLAAWCRNTPKPEEDKEGNSKSDDADAPRSYGLYSVTPPEEGEKVGLAEVVDDYIAMGSGGLFAQYLLDRLHAEGHSPQTLTVEEGIIEAIYVIHEVNKIDLYCGGEIHAAYIKPGQGQNVLVRKTTKENLDIKNRLESNDSPIKTKQREMLVSIARADP